MEVETFIPKYNEPLTLPAMAVITGVGDMFYDGKVVEVLSMNGAWTRTTHPVYNINFQGEILTCGIRYLQFLPQTPIPLEDML